MKKSNSWMSIVLALFITWSVILIWSYLIESAVPFWDNVVWVDKSLDGYYSAVSWAEKAVLEIKSNPWQNLANEEIIDWNWDKKQEYDFTWKSTTFPEPWKWNAEWDNNYNYLSKKEPIIFTLNNGELNIWDIKIHYKIPTEVQYNHLTWTSASPVYNLDPKTGEEDSPILWWTISWKTSDNEPVAIYGYLTYNNIDTFNKVIPFSDNYWSIIWNFNWTRCEVQDALDGNCWGAKKFDLSKQILVKITLLKNLDHSWSNHKTKQLYYKIEWLNSTTLINKNASLEASWTSHWYKRKIEINTSQIPTGNTSLDFTILQ